MSEDELHYIYVIAHEPADARFQAPVKVGITRNLKSRIRTIQTSAPGKVSLFCAFMAPRRDIARTLETAFHTVMREKRLSGEWFDIHPLMAMQWMCVNIRVCLTNWVGLEGEDLDGALDFSGVLHAESQLEILKRRSRGETLQ